MCHTQPVSQAEAQTHEAGWLTDEWTPHWRALSMSVVSRRTETHVVSCFAKKASVHTLREDVSGEHDAAGGCAGTQHGHGGGRWRVAVALSVALAARVTLLSRL